MPQQLTEAREPVNALYYGEGGTGKTTHLAGMANLGRVLAINAESGIKARPLKARGVPVENIEVFPGPGEELSFEGLEAMWLQMYEELQQDQDAWAGVFWDSVTEIQQALKDISVKSSVARAQRMGRERSSFVVDQDNWREVNEQCRSLIRKFRDLPCHFGASALSRREQDDDGSVSYFPSVTPGLQNDLIGWMDIVSVTSVAIVDGEEEFRGLQRRWSKFLGKDRFGATPKWLVDPTFDRMVGYVDGDLTVDDDPIMAEAKERAARESAKDKADPVPAAA